VFIARYDVNNHGLSAGLRKTRDLNRKNNPPGFFWASKENNVFLDF